MSDEPYRFTWRAMLGNLADFSPTSRPHPIVINTQEDADRLFGPGAFHVPSQRPSVFVRVPASCDSDPPRRTTCGSVTLVIDDMPVRDVTRIKIEE